MIYFDNAATSNAKPQSVINNLIHVVRDVSANPGRSGHDLAKTLSQMVFDTRVKLAAFFHGYSPENVIFTKNCTEALNLAILGSVKEGGHVITSMNEHNSTLRPLFELERAKIIKLSIVAPDEDGKISPCKIESQITADTYLVAINHASNVTGATSDIYEIGKLCRKKNILFLTDTAQSAGHIDISMEDQQIDMLAFAGHKGLLGVQGSGGLIFNDRVSLKPICFGGTGTESDNLYQPKDSPEAFESGTVNSPAICALSSAIDYINVHKQSNARQLQENQSYLYSRIVTMPKIKIFSKKNHVGIISLLVGNTPSTTTTAMLNDTYHIATRGGLHCAPLIHRHLKTTNSGLVRISASAFNTRSDCENLIKALYRISME